MKAIILAAGRGSRMGEQTRDLPKCLAPLAGRTLLEWQVSSLRAAGVDDIVVVRGYRSGAISGDFSTLENLRWESTNMVRTLQSADVILASEPCLVSYSDIVYHPDHVRSLAGSPGEIAVTCDRSWLDLWSLRFEDPLSDAETFRHRDGRLLEIGGKSGRVEEIEAQYMGLLLFRPEGWARVSAKLGELGTAADRLDMTGLLRTLLGDGAEIRTVEIDGRWCEADDQNDLARYEERIAFSERDGVNWKHDWRWER